jgi:hypothetical protein
MTRNDWLGVVLRLAMFPVGFLLGRAIGHLAGLG